MRFEVFISAIKISQCSGLQRCDRDWLDVRHWTEVPQYWRPARSRSSFGNSYI